MTNLKITAHFQSYWHCGTGRGAGQHLDALVEKDHDGLPQVSGKMIKGLFRDAVNKMEQWQQVSKNTTAILFGSDSIAKDKTKPGSLNFSACTLPKHIKTCLSVDPLLKKHLYKTHSKTAINHQTQTAQKGSLRSLEVVIPITLESEIIQISEAKIDNIHHIIQQASSLITNIGAHKNRGYGEVKWEITKMNSTHV